MVNITPRTARLVPGISLRRRINLGVDSGVLVYISDRTANTKIIGRYHQHATIVFDPIFNSYLVVYL